MKTCYNLLGWIYIYIYIYISKYVVFHENFESGNDLSEFYGQHTVHIRFYDLLQVFLMIFKNRLGSLGMNSGDFLQSSYIKENLVLYRSIKYYCFL